MLWFLKRTDWSVRAATDFFQAEIRGFIIIPVKTN